LLSFFLLQTNDKDEHLTTTSVQATKRMIKEQELAGLGSGRDGMKPERQIRSEVICALASVRTYNRTIAAQ
jgi:hypothetical protein